MIISHRHSGKSFRLSGVLLLLTLSVSLLGPLVFTGSFDRSWFTWFDRLFFPLPWNRWGQHLDELGQINQYGRQLRNRRCDDECSREEGWFVWNHLRVSKAYSRDCSREKRMQQPMIRSRSLPSSSTFKFSPLFLGPLLMVAMMSGEINTWLKTSDRFCPRG